MDLAGCNPCDCFKKMFVSFNAKERKATKFPSRDQTPTTASLVSKVKRELVPRLRSLSQRLTLFALASAMSSANRLPSGERVGFARTPTSPTRPNSFPARSNQVRTDSVEQHSCCKQLYRSLPRRTLPRKLTVGSRL